MKKTRRAAGDHHVLVREDCTIALTKDDKQFLVHGDISNIRPVVRGTNARLTKLSDTSAIVRCTSASQRDRLMTLLRRTNVVHHAYRDTNSNNLMILSDRITIRFQSDHPDVSVLMKRFGLELVGTIGSTYVFRLTSETGCNPLKLAHKLQKNKSVKSCTPEFMAQQQSSLFRNRQWTLSDLFREGWNSGLFATGNISALGARALKIAAPSSEVVVAVMDDGFDLVHEALKSNISLNAKDFVVPANKGQSGPNDSHGTPVAGIAIGNSTEFSGIAPGCMFLPIRIPVALANPSDIMFAIKHASEFADVLNISLEMRPQFSKHDILSHSEEIDRITKIGGRRRKGLVIVVAAGNNCFPTQLSSQENNAKRKAVNDNSVEFLPGQSIYTGYPNLPGVIVVSSVTSQNRLASYSNWGREVSVAGCSGDQTSSDGATVISTQNDSSGLKIDPANSKYATNFNGTSAAAPMVAGLAALIISLNPDLEASEVRRIIEMTADKNLDTAVSLVRYPNLRRDTSSAFDGGFINGKSLLFGYGRINAYRAVLRALALKETIGGEQNRKAAFNCPMLIPSNDKRGLCNSVLLSPDDVSNIELEIRGQHPNCNLILFTLISPEGFYATLNSNGVVANPFTIRFSPSTSPELSSMLQKPIQGNGKWILNIQNMDATSPAQIDSIVISVS